MIVASTLNILKLLDAMFSFFWRRGVCSFHDFSYLCIQSSMDYSCMRLVQMSSLVYMEVLWWRISGWYSVEFWCRYHVPFPMNTLSRICCRVCGVQCCWGCLRTVSWLVLYRWTVFIATVVEKVWMRISSQFKRRIVLWRNSFSFGLYHKVIGVLQVRISDDLHRARQLRVNCRRRPPAAPV